MQKWNRLEVSLLVLLICVVALTGNVTAAEDPFNYITPGETKSMIESGEALTLLDIQVEEDYNRHHIKGSLATYAYPVKSSYEKASLDKVVPNLEANTYPVVIICPRGGGGAKRTFKYLVDRGIEDDRMFILENGQSGWPYPELIESN